MNRTSPVKPDLPCSLEQMRRHAVVGGSLPRREAVALLDRVEQLQGELELWKSVAIACDRCSGPWGRHGSYIAHHSHRVQPSEHVCEQCATVSVAAEPTR